MSRNIPPVREYLIRCRELRQPTPGAWSRLYDVVYRVLAPTPTLARLNLTHEIYGCRTIVSVAAARKPIGLCPPCRATEESARLTYPRGEAARRLKAELKAILNG